MNAFRLVNSAYYFGSQRGFDAMCRKVEICQPNGPVASQLLRARWRSHFAKRALLAERKYRQKSKALARLCELLAGSDLVWGWGKDVRQGRANHVLFVELPTFGQVSFHNLERHKGPDYLKLWDGSRTTDERIVRFAAAVLHQHHYGTPMNSARSA